MESSDSEPEAVDIWGEAKLFAEGVEGVKVEKHRKARQSYLEKAGKKPVNRRVAKECSLCPSVTKQLRRHILSVHKDLPQRARDQKHQYFVCKYKKPQEFKYNYVQKTL